MGKKHFPAFLKCLRLACILHTLDECVHLLGLDACQIIAHTDIELIAVHTSKSVFLRHERKQEPCLDVLLLRLRHIELCGPLTVIAFVIRLNTGLIHTCGKLGPVHDLHRLQFEEPAPCIVGCRNILRKLAVRACRRSDRRLKPASEDGLRLLTVRRIRSMYSKYRILLVMLSPNPVQQLFKRHTCHNITHINSSLSVNTLPQLRRLFTASRHGLFYICNLYFSVLHKHFPVTDRRHNISSGHSE